MEDGAWNTSGGKFNKRYLLFDSEMSFIDTYPKVFLNVCKDLGTGSLSQRYLYYLNQEQHNDPQ